MAKIGEPILAPSKKRSWNTTLHGRSPLHSRRDGGGDGNFNFRRAPRRRDGAPSPAKPTPRPRPGPAEPADARATDLRAVLRRYHSLALTHCASSKRRRLESDKRSSQSSRRIERLASLQRMARETLDLCTEVLRGEEEARSANERERREAEEEVRRAEGEMALAEDFLSRFGMGGGSGGRGGDYLGPEDPAEGGRDENVENEGGRTIGGIPSKFLDLSHFPKLKKSKRDLPFSPEEGGGKHPPIIDCTNESPRRRRPDGFDGGSRGPSPLRPMRIPSFGASGEAAPPCPTKSKQNTKRIYIARASLSHVNGTYVQEGRHNDAPLFVRVGPPRKFMGKWDCSVVLRREEKEAKGARGSGADGGKGEAEKEYVWKIGLVPAHRVSHPRIMGYYAADDNPDKNGLGAMMPTSKRPFDVDQMEEDDDDGEVDTYFEPPVDGWRVFQEAPAGVGAGNVGNALGRASSLTVSYEE